MFAPVQEPTQWELDYLSRVMLTSDTPWDPGQLNDDANGQVVYPDCDDIINDDMQAFINQAHNESDSGGIISEEEMQATLKYINGLRRATPVTTQINTDYSKYQANLGWAPVDQVKVTFQNITQLEVSEKRIPLRKHFK